MKESTNDQLVPAVTGYSVIEAWLNDDETDASHDLSPVVAWRIGRRAGASPVSISGAESMVGKHCLQDTWAVLRPDGSVETGECESFDDLLEYKRSLVLWHQRKQEKKEAA